MAVVAHEDVVEVDEGAAWQDVSALGTTNPSATEHPTPNNKTPNP